MRFRLCPTWHREDGAHVVWSQCWLSLLLTLPARAQSKGPIRITLDEAIQMALQHNHNLLAARTTIQQSEAEEITANLRPNPTLFADWEYLPLGSPLTRIRAFTRLVPQRLSAQQFGS